MYVDVDYAYKYVQQDNVGDIENIKKYVGKNHPHVVNIYDVWVDEDNMLIIRMERLEEIPMDKVSDLEEFDRVRDILWNSQDDVSNIMNLKSTDMEVQRMIDAIISANEYLGYMDMGFHNLMYDPKTDEYKQIDIF